MYAFGACITIQLSQLADANFGHSDIISSVNGGLITNCITLFFATRSFDSLPRAGTMVAFGPIVRSESECYARARRHNMLRRMPVNFAARGCKHGCSVGDKISSARHEVQNYITVTFQRALRVSVNGLLVDENCNIIEYDFGLIVKLSDRWKFIYIYFFEPIFWSRNNYLYISDYYKFLSDILRYVLF